MRTTCSTNKVLACAAGVAMAAGVWGGTARAAEFSTDAGGGPLRVGYTGNAPFAGSLGTQFTVGGTDLIVNTLGYYDGPNSAAGAEGDGLLESHQLGIFDNAGNLLTNATVGQGGGTLVGDFRYVPTTSITLTAGSTYVLVGQVPTTTGDTFRDAGAANVNQTDLTVVQGRYSAPPENPDYFDGEFEFPTSGGTGGPGLVYFGPSFQYELVPEPASLGLIALAGLGLLRRRRRA